MKGPRYDSSLDVTVIATRLREHIKRAQWLPDSHPLHLPVGTAATVRIQRYAGGRSIDVRITKFPDCVLNPAKVLSNELFPMVHLGFRINTPEFTRATAVIELMARAYNRDDSDLQSDYYSVHFSFDVDAQWELREASKADILTRSHRDLLEDARIALKTEGRGYVERQLASVDAHGPGVATPSYLGKEHIADSGRYLDELDALAAPSKPRRKKPASNPISLASFVAAFAPPPPPKLGAPTPRYAESGTRLTDCCGAYSTYNEDSRGEFTLCCKACWREVGPGQGDGSASQDSALTS